VIDTISKLVDSENEKVMHEAVNALIKLLSLVGKDDLTNKLLELMQSKNEKLQITSINVLASLDRTVIKNKRIMNKLLEFVESENERLQLAVIQTLSSVTWKIGEDERLGIKNKLLKLVDSKNEEIQLGAIHISGRLAEEEGIAGKLINKYLELIRDKRENVRLAAAYGLLHLRHDWNDGVVNELLKLAYCEDEKLQDVALAALSFSTKEEKILNTFLELIDSKSEIVRVRAICALMGGADFGRIKTATGFPFTLVDEKKFMNKLLKELKCENEQVKAAALVALIRLNKCKLVKEEIIETFESTSELLQLVGILGLTELMIKDERLTAKLLKYLESENVWIQFAAGQALKKLVEPDQENLGVLSFILYNDKASKEWYDLQSVPLFPFIHLMVYFGFFKTSCDFIYETFRDFVVRWEEKKSSHKAKATSFSYTPRIKD
jgi:HEAT repeat protein